MSPGETARVNGVSDSRIPKVSKRSMNGRFRAQP
jgi:hypothetical protein